MMRFMVGLVLLAVPLVPAAGQDRGTVVTGKRGMVVCVSPEAADVGVAILKQGGNAVDAAVAIALAEAVAYPAAGNIGGGGFMLVYPPGGDPTVIEYRETAPAAVNRGTFAKTTDWHDHKAVGIPGTLRGLEMAHKKFGKLPWKDLVAPAIRLASEGFALDAPMAKSLNEVMKKAKNDEFRRLFGKDGGKTPWKAGDRLVQKDLARTLQRIANNGPGGFYSGELAELLVAEMQAGGGFVTKEDLSAYQAKERKPTHGLYRGYDVYGPPPPSSGGIGLVEMLNILETFDLRKMGAGSAESRHVMAEAMRRAFVDRAKYLGDPDFARVPGFLMDKEYAKKLAATIDLARATPSASLADGITLSNEGGNTTHFSIIDAAGMAVSNTYTLEDSYGSRVAVRGAGYILNNEMGDFNARPGVTTATGRIGTEPNLVAPGKRMLSSQTPTIIAKGGKPLLVTGSPGGRTIINTVACVVTNVIDFEMDIQAAVDGPRQHHQWYPDELKLESKDVEVRAKLASLGHKVGSEPTQGDAHSIWIDPKTGVYHGAADKRINGKAAGY